jgi:hypothetical protein
VVAVALMWGLAVGIGAGSVMTFAGGVALAAINAVVGDAIGMALRGASMLVRHLLPRR